MITIDAGWAKTSLEADALERDALERIRQAVHQRLPVRPAPQCDSGEMPQADEDSHRVMGSRRDLVRPTAVLRPLAVVKR